MVTYFVVQAYQAGKNGYLVPDQPREVPSERQAEMAARLLAASRPAVLAFSRSGDPTSDSAGDTAGDPRASRQPRRGSTRGSLVQNSQVQNRPIQALEGRADQEWVNDYERASRGQ